MLTREACDGVIEPRRLQVCVERCIQSKAGGKSDAQPARFQVRYALAQHVRRFILGAQHAIGPAAEMRRRTLCLHVVCAARRSEMENGVPACHRHTKPTRQGRGVGRLRDETGGKQYLVDWDTAAPRFRLSNRQRRTADTGLQEEGVLPARAAQQRGGLRRLSQARLWRYTIAGNRLAMGNAIPRTAMHSRSTPPPPQ